MTDNGNTKMDADDKFVMYKALATAEERKMEIDKLNRENDKLKREKEELEARLRADNQMDGNDKIEMYEALAIAEERKMEVDRLSREKEELAEKLKKMEVVKEASPSTSKGDNGKDGLLALFLEDKDEQERLFQEWKQQLSLKKVKEILGKDLMRNEDLTRLLTKLKNPVTRANFNRWCEEALAEGKNWPDDYVLEEVKRLASPKVAPEKRITLVPDGYVYVQKPPAAPAPGERNDSLGRGGSAEKQPPSDQDIVDGNNSLVPPGNNSLEGKRGSLVEGSLKGATQRGTKKYEEKRGTKGGVSTTKSTSKTPKAPTTDSESEAEEAPKKTKVLPEAGLDTYNILVVGDSGVGKTTFINGLANYFEYSTWEKNMENGPNVRINTQFTVVNLDNKPVTIVSKSSYETTREERNNENLGGQGESVTQKPVTHTFLIEREKRSFNVNVIDTPGLNDTRGARQDHMSIQKIIEHIRELKQLNTIVLLLTADQPRMTSQFRHFLNELLTQFDKESLKNLLFCYTRTRPFNYKPGDALGTLREYLDEQSKRSGVSITLETRNVFCIDNDCFRYLCLVDQFPDCESEWLNKEFGECWSQTRRELSRLLKSVRELTPYKLDASADLTKLRQMVNVLALPQGEIAKMNVSCTHNYERTFSQVHKHYDKSGNGVLGVTASRVSKDEEELLKSLSFYENKLAEMKKERCVILDLCAQIHVHIAYKGATKTTDEFRIQLIDYIKEAEEQKKQGGDPAMIKDLISAVEYYEEKVMEILNEVKEKKRNILTEYEIERQMNELPRLKHYGSLLANAMDVKVTSTSTTL